MSCGAEVLIVFLGGGGRGVLHSVLPLPGGGLDSPVSDMVVGDGSGLPRALCASRGEHPSVLTGGEG